MKLPYFQTLLGDEYDLTCSEFYEEKYNTCKKQCTSNNCNAGGMAEISCQVCTETFTHLGVQVSGDYGCYNSSTSYKTTCPTGSNFCATAEFEKKFIKLILYSNESYKIERTFF